MYLETFLHSLIGVLYAAALRPSVLHIHGIGPSLLAPIARMLGMRVVVTHHGQDYQREKWNALAKGVLRLGEWAAANFSNGRIVIAPGLEKQLQGRFGVPFAYIPNGVGILDRTDSTGELGKLGVKPGQYVLNVARVVPEKRQLDLIEAFSRISRPDVQLVLAGANDHSSRYAKEVQALVKKDKRVVAPGVVTGEALRQLYSHAAVFTLPSSHEGLPIALLEAMAYRLPVVVSNIQPLLEMNLPSECYVELGDTAALSERLDAYLSAATNGSVGRSWQTELAPYSWDIVAQNTRKLYMEVTRSGAVSHVNSESGTTDARISRA